MGFLSRAARELTPSSIPSQTKRPILRRPYIASLDCRPLVFLGPPGAGKGTQARRIAKLLSIPHISTGDMFRANVEKETPLGKLVNFYITAGKLVGDDLVNEMVRLRITQEDCDGGFLLDGYPRTLMQARALKEILNNAEKKDPIVVNLTLNPDTVVERLSERRICVVCNRTYDLSSLPSDQPRVCIDDGSPLRQRPDDCESVIRERLSAYEAQTAPLIEYYRGQGNLFEVDGNQFRDRITHELTRLLQAEDYLQVGY